MSESTTWDAFCGRLFDQNAFAIKLGLDNIRRAFALEGHPERCAPAIVVGGTNGKGSVASALAAILTAHGVRTGLYTSPHLVEFRERFRIDGKPVGRERVMQHGRVVLQRYGDDDADPCLTFFELSTLIAARIFAEAGVDVVVWEVGLGGRLDAVNAIDPSLTIVTRIDFDHMQYLGDTLVEIAGEKAGLHRDGVPLVLAQQRHADVYEVFDFPEVIRCGPRARAEPESADPDRRPLSRAASSATAENLSTASVAAREYLGARFDEKLERAGLDAWRWPGRFDWRSANGRRFLLDAAHNPAGVSNLMDYLRAEPPAACIVGAMADKDLSAMFAPLRELDVPVFGAEIASGRAASADQLRAAIGKVAATGSASELFERASDIRDYVVVFGSIYLLGEWFAWADVAVDELVTFER